MEKTTRGDDFGEGRLTETDTPLVDATALLTSRIPGRAGGPRGVGELEGELCCCPALRSSTAPVAPGSHHGEERPGRLVAGLLLSDRSRSHLDSMRLLGPRLEETGLGLDSIL